MTDLHLRDFSKCQHYSLLYFCSHRQFLPRSAFQCITSSAHFSAWEVTGPFGMLPLVPSTDALGMALMRPASLGSHGPLAA